MTLPEGKQRARTEEDRALRRAALLGAAREAIEDGVYDDATMADIAEAVGLSKASAYLYFETKEDLFLSLLEHDLEAWFEIVETGVQKSRGEPVAALSKLVARTLARTPALLTLLSLLHGRLEHGAPQSAVLRFKQFLWRSLTRVGAVLDSALSAPKGFGVRLLLRAHALAIGLGQMASPPQVVQDVMNEHPSLRAMNIDFETEMARTLEDVARGMLVTR